MDVYEITDRISFSDSVADAAVAGTEEPVTNDFSATGDVDQIDSTDKASPGTTSSIFLITIGMMLFGYFAL